MTLVGNYGEVDSIFCDVADMDVVSKDDGGTLAMTGKGYYTTLKASGASNIPAECPLLIDQEEFVGGHGRNLGQFAVCVSCPHSSIDQVGPTEC
jgi:hypothetical protein